jgi:hypothetical protein
MAVKLSVAFIAMYGIAFILVISFQCHPIAGIWDKNLEATCINLNLVSYASAGVSIFQDILILLLPIPELWSLNVSFRKRLNIMVMFSVGIL